MGKCYCDYCDVFLTNDSVAVRKQHNDGNRHKYNVCEYYRQYIGHRLQRQIDAIVQQFEADVANGLVHATYALPPIAKPAAAPDAGATAPALSHAPGVAAAAPAPASAAPASLALAAPAPASVPAHAQITKTHSPSPPPPPPPPPLPSLQSQPPPSQQPQSQQAQPPQQKQQVQNNNAAQIPAQ
ncbi:U1 small nuclear ribonucleoprotein C-2 [Gracilariopsis chorda]|uniref:U1 small nuclear ribonucleoprotein C-2 n=1 Tax=Gracilariopsis chorda TaxID=448386 RepID=A0A2V3IH51_9FLOR|nr:U1 small nuclear ribonucleoprotein C-2 [Gracilariopsis chorda]|eukprot:PXF41421.1 U1 small nuclear ribonucleoprotein C-2 [Gracilariopsis chorda]